MRRFQIIAGNVQIIATGFEWWFCVLLLLLCAGGALAACAWGIDAGLREAITSVGHL